MKIYKFPCPCFLNKLYKCIFSTSDGSIKCLRVFTFTLLLCRSPISQRAVLPLRGAETIKDGKSIKESKALQIETAQPLPQPLGEIQAEAARYFRKVGHFASISYAPDGESGSFPAG